MEYCQHDGRRWVYSSHNNELRPKLSSQGSQNGENSLVGCRNGRPWKTAEGSFIFPQCVCPHWHISLQSSLPYLSDTLSPNSDLVLGGILPCSQATYGLVPMEARPSMQHLDPSTLGFRFSYEDLGSMYTSKSHQSLLTQGGSFLGHDSPCGWKLQAHSRPTMETIALGYCQLVLCGPKLQWIQGRATLEGSEFRFHRHGLQCATASPPGLCFRITHTLSSCRLPSPHFHS